MGARPGEKRENWLLIKGSDDAARTPEQPDILDEAPESVISGRTVEDIAAGRPAEEGAREPRGREGRKDPLPGLRPAGARDAARLGARAARPGCTRSSSTATACRRRSGTAR